MKSLMFEEALAAADQVRLQLAFDNEQYKVVGDYLRRHPPHSVATIARGSSDHAASYFAYLLMARLGHMVTSLPMSLINQYHAPLKMQGMLAIAISQSGKSADLIDAMLRLREGGASTLAMVNDVASPLFRSVEWGFTLSAGPEHSVAATKSFICSLVACARLLAHWKNDVHFIQAIEELPSALDRACTQDWSAAIESLKSAEKLMVVGRGLGLSIASEAALKFKETCSIQAEAFSGAEIKHGPMALIDQQYPLFIFAPRGPVQNNLILLADEMRQRGANVWLAAPDDVPSRNLTLATAQHPDLDPICAIQSFYLLVESVSIAKGFNPDKPRHLSKVTVTR